MYIVFQLIEKARNEGEKCLSFFLRVKTLLDRTCGDVTCSLKMVRASLKHFLFIRGMVALWIISFQRELRRALIFFSLLRSYNSLQQAHK